MDNVVYSVNARYRDSRHVEKLCPQLATVNAVSMVTSTARIPHQIRANPPYGLSTQNKSDTTVSAHITFPESISALGSIYLIRFSS